MLYFKIKFANRQIFLFVEYMYCTIHVYVSKMKEDYNRDSEWNIFGLYTKV